MKPREPVEYVRSALRGAWLSEVEVDAICTFVRSRLVPAFYHPTSVRQFCDRYMDGMQPTQWQADYIEHLLTNPKNPMQWMTWPGHGGGKTTLRHAIIRYLEDAEANGG
jgi:hypothetical protein